MSDKPDPPVDRLDGYSPMEEPEGVDWADDPSVLAALERLADEQVERARRDGYHQDELGDFRRQLMDGYRNVLTGIGDPGRDKTLGGHHRGRALEFLFNLLTGTEIESRWRGSDLGSRIVETIPDEMTRSGWEIVIQPDEEPEPPTGGAPTGTPKLPGPPPNKPKAPSPFTDAAPEPIVDPARPTPAPELNLPDKDGPAQSEALQRRMDELGVTSVFREALCYERAYGGAVVLLGIDDGGMPLTSPLDMRKVRSLKHLTTYRGGWDGEVIAWRYYADPRKPRYGEPEMFMLRNIGVPIMSPAAPGENFQPPPPAPAGPAGPMVFWVHESRLLVFPGRAVSRHARVQTRGWGDSIFSRVDEVLSQYGQTWGGLASLMTEWSLGVLKVKGLAQALAANTPEKDGALRKRAIMLQLTQSIARVRMIDTEEEYARETTTLGGVAEVLQQFALRLAAAADMPLSMLMGQVKGGLGDAGNTDLRFFYDKVKAKQEEQLVPQLKRMIRILMLSEDSPTSRRVPERWDVNPRPLWQPTELEDAQLRKTQADTDAIYLDRQVISPNEVAASRFGGSKYSTETVLDLEGRAKMALAQAKAGTKPGGGGAAPASAAASPVGSVGPATPSSPGMAAGNAASTSPIGETGGKVEPMTKTEPQVTTLENTPNV